ncbi:MAG: hypothetical protein M0Q21_04560 [Ignavibacteriaceae bacterium]|nr:hypothetical protein [Ignavibacteriaceae bacterium]
MIFYWLIGGIVITTLTFFLSIDNINLWKSLNASAIVALAYCIVLIIFNIKLFPLKRKIVLIAVFVIGVFFVFKSWSLAYEQSTWQKETLLRIRGSISRGVLNVSLNNAMLHVLSNYHSQADKNKKSLKEIYNELIKTDSGFIETLKLSQEDSPLIYNKVLSDTELVFIGQEIFVKGRNPDFANASGKKGMVQVRATLTSKGVKYESEN